MNEFLKPLVHELQKFWTGAFIPLVQLKFDVLYSVLHATYQPLEKCVAFWGIQLTLDVTNV